MNQKELSTLTDEALLQEVKKSKTTVIFDAAIIGVLIGISVFSIVKKGFGLLSLLPLIYIPIATRNRKYQKALEKLLKERNLK
ncbi:hypothetical protein LQ567_08485 [Niabella pedocola]|uniref:FUSC family protein n=1 Tax=Niabella pedocola TaxID=1752077 RepID=A0ABS8PNY8_9BACT|nr:hypothetical protein [Niabella pedocola]MCD2422795.1 hypothetical protein [Niabella pedocola]